MGNPYRRHTPSRRNSRRAQNWKLEPGAAHTCSNCKEVCPPHVVCPHCGFYDGKLVVAKKVKKGKGKKEGEQGGEQAA